MSASNYLVINWLLNHEPFFLVIAIIPRQTQLPSHLGLRTAPVRLVQPLSFICKCDFLISWVFSEKNYNLHSNAKQQSKCSPTIHFILQQVQVLVSEKWRLICLSGILFYFIFHYPPFSGIASCVGTAGTVKWCLLLLQPCCVALGRVLI